VLFGFLVLDGTTLRVLGGDFLLGVFFGEDLVFLAPKLLDLDAPLLGDFFFFSDSGFGAPSGRIALPLERPSVG
tara:strand:+ start:3931 stop:4152 length:222 start_codon:yes stop_codon:yes gene_type:complete